MPKKYVCDYSGLNFNEIEDLPMDEFKLLLRDAFIYKLSKTKAGREHLENCWLLEQTKPDKSSLKKRFGQ